MSRSVTGHPRRNVTNCWLWARFLGKNLILNSGTVPRSISSSGNLRLFSEFSGRLLKRVYVSRRNPQPEGWAREGWILGRRCRQWRIDRLRTRISAGGRSVVSHHASVISDRFGTKIAAQYLVTKHPKPTSREIFMASPEILRQSQEAGLQKLQHVKYEER